MKRKVAPLIAAMAALFLGQATLQGTTIFPLWKKNFAPLRADLTGLDPSQLLFAFAGFRELIAGILWVRADAFFDEGNFDAVLPMIWLVTRLDPHQIDVYATGMWHIAYNFTDEGSRSDRRYIPSAVALGREGARNNDQTYELFFETGWLYYHKIEDDYPEAVKWFEQAAGHKDIMTARRNLLNNVYQRNNEVDKAANYLYGLLEESQERYKKAPNEFVNMQNRDTIEQNYDNLLVRMAQRGYLAKKEGYYPSWDYDTKPPFDVGFSAQVTVIEPRVIKIVGTWNVLPVGTRIRVVMRDADYPNAIPAGMKWYQGENINLDPPKDRTFMQDQLFVKNQRFNRTIDMGRDRTMYPFTSDKYVIEFYYNPRQAPAYIQDKFGWNGEGMTDKNFINNEVRPGNPVVYTRMEVSRDQIERRGEWKDVAPVFQTKNYAGLAPTQVDQGVIKVPGILEQPKTQSAPSTPGKAPGISANE
ncbi:MAG: hypothetical protein KIT11_02915 [Fimbriimonadaceae bacterium]|nr:hypothetical protein [Fimbriimonadaceae bacterium]QYK54681.1 MAG: hypothetical protein KF733_06610 [Fimbriimonadaceae bacterium]